MVVVTTTIIKLVLGLIGIYINDTPPKDLPFLFVSRLWMLIHQFIERGVPCKNIYIHMSYCMLTVEMLTPHHWLQGSTRTVRVQWSMFTVR